MHRNAKGQRNGGRLTAICYRLILVCFPRAILGVTLTQTWLKSYLSFSLVKYFRGIPLSFFLFFFLAMQDLSSLARD